MKKKALNVALLLSLSGSLLSSVMFLLPSSVNDDFQVLPSMVQELGKIRQGTSVKIEFNLLNQGSEQIQILDVGTNCGCTSSDFSRQQILPGAEASVNLTYNSGHFRGPVAIHAIVVYQRADEEQSQSIVLGAKGQIDPDYDVTPERLKFKMTGTRAKSIVLQPRHISKLNVTRAICNKRFFSATIDGVDESGRQGITIVFDPEDYYPDSGPAHVAIHTDSIRQPILMLPLEVAIQKATITTD